MSLKLIPCGLSLHTHTHYMSWVVYLNFLCPGKYLCWLKSQISFISPFSFEMLFDCAISGLYMRVLKTNMRNVSILASFCVWTKSLVCVKMLHRDSTIQKCFRVRRFSVPCQASGRSSHPVRMPICHCSIRLDDMPYCPDSRKTKHHLSGRCVSPSGPFTVSRRFYPACIHLDVSAARPDASQYSTCLRFFPSSNKWKINQPSERCGIPFKRESP
jgi:hypothetical protein